MISVIQGHWNELLNRENDLSESRLIICRECPLFKNSVVGIICNKELTLNPITGEVDTENKPGFYRGCNCRLEAKTRNVGAHCPANKW